MAEAILGVYKCEKVSVSVMMDHKKCGSLPLPENFESRFLEMQSGAF